MADAVTSQTIIDGDRTAVMKFTNISDGSGESSVKKVDVSALATSSRDGATCARVHITQIWYIKKFCIPTCDNIWLMFLPKR